jgi:hypothetical protein
MLSKWAKTRMAAIWSRADLPDRTISRAAALISALSSSVMFHRLVTARAARRSSDARSRLSGIGRIAPNPPGLGRGARSFSVISAV